MDSYIYGYIGIWIVRQMDSWIDGTMDGYKDRQIDNQIYQTIR